MPDKSWSSAAALFPGPSAAALFPVGATLKEEPEEEEGGGALAQLVDRLEEVQNQRPGTHRSAISQRSMESADDDPSALSPSVLARKQRWDFNGEEERKSGRQSGGRRGAPIVSEMKGGRPSTSEGGFGNYNNK